MNQIQEVFDYQDHQVRTITQDKSVWFVAKDVCDILDYVNHREAVNKLDVDEKGVSFN